MEIEFGPFETFSYAIYKEGSAWQLCEHEACASIAQNMGDAQRKKKRKLLNRCFPSQYFAIWLENKNPIFNQFSNVTKHAWILLPFKWSVGSCSSTKCSWKTLQLSSSLACGIFQDKGSTSMACATHSERTNPYSGSEHVLLWSALTTCTPADQPSCRLHCSHLLLQGKWFLGQIKPKQI